MTTRSKRRKKRKTGRRSRRKTWSVLEQAPSGESNWVLQTKPSTCFAPEPGKCSDKQDGQHGGQGFIDYGAREPRYENAAGSVFLRHTEKLSSNSCKGNHGCYGFCLRSGTVLSYVISRRVHKSALRRATRICVLGQNGAVSCCHSNEACGRCWRGGFPLCAGQHKVQPL